MWQLRYDTEYSCANSLKLSILVGDIVPLYGPLRGS